jgi:hypothetical protein
MEHGGDRQYISNTITIVSTTFSVCYWRMFFHCQVLLHSVPYEPSDIQPPPIPSFGVANVIQNNFKCIYKTYQLCTMHGFNP